jgi:hypothetical protein
MLLKLSVVVPVAPGEDAWTRLLPDFASLPKGGEILFVGPERPDGLPASVNWIDAPLGRARQMNLAARAATGEFLWFLHADSRIPVGGVRRLAASLEEAPDALHYFDLAYGHGSPRLMSVNEVGVWLRSRVLKLPFGDQGLCLRKDLWTRLGGFPEDQPYGEDHLLVWRALRQGVTVKPVGARLVTSARKYQKQGWLKTTLRHQYLTYKQALPELVALVKDRVTK